MKNKRNNLLSNKDVAIFTVLILISGYLGDFLFGLVGAAIAGALAGLVAYSIIKSINRKRGLIETKNKVHAQRND